MFWKCFCKITFNVDCSIILCCKWSKRDIDKVSNMFYKQVLPLWLELYDTKVKNAKDVHNQFIWKNANIRIGGKPIFYKKWIHKGVLTIADVTNCDGHMLSREECCNKFNINVHILDYLSFFDICYTQ